MTFPPIFLPVTESVTKCVHISTSIMLLSRSYDSVVIKKRIYEISSQTQSVFKYFTLKLHNVDFIVCQFVKDVKVFSILGSVDGKSF